MSKSPRTWHIQVPHKDSLLRGREVLEYAKNAENLTYSSSSLSLAPCLVLQCPLLLALIQNSTRINCRRPTFLCRCFVGDGSEQWRTCSDRYFPISSSSTSNNQIFSSSSSSSNNSNSNTRQQFDTLFTLSFFVRWYFILPIDAIEYFSSKVSDKSQDILWNNNRSASIVRSE